METDESPNQSVVCPTFCSWHGFCDLDITDVLPEDSDIIKLMPLLETGIHAHCLVLVGQHEECIGNIEVILSIHAQEQ